MEKYLLPKEGWLNRHTDGLPKEECQITILHSDGEFTGTWRPYNEADYKNSEEKPAEGYLGTFKVGAKFPHNIGFHAWQQNNSEFVFYKLQS